MKVSIIVPAFNEEKLLGESLAKTKAATSALVRVGWDTELIVCDNNSTDRTADIARAAGATVVFESVNQISRARNRGVASATGDWLVFIDADSYPSAGLFGDMVKEIRSGNCIGGGATIRWDQANLRIALVTPPVNLLFRWRKVLSGAFIFVETAVFRKLGGFNNAVFAGEDVELGWRLRSFSRETGKQFVILHRHPVTTSARRAKYFSVFTHLRFMLQITFNVLRVATSRDAAHRWYDGRRW